MSSVSGSIEADSEALGEFQQAMAILRRDLQSNTVLPADSPELEKASEAGNTFLVLKKSTVADDASSVHIQYSYKNNAISRRVSAHNTVELLRNIQSLSAQVVEYGGGSDKKVELSVKHESFGLFQLNFHLKEFEQIVTVNAPQLAGGLGFVKEDQPFVNPNVEAIW